MKLHLRAMGCHKPYVTTNLPPDTSEHLTPARGRYLILPIWEGWKAESTEVNGYIPRWFTRTHPGTNPAAHGRELNSRPVDHKSDALTHHTVHNSTLPSLPKRHHHIAP